MIRAFFASIILVILAGSAQAGGWDRGRVPLCDQPPVLNSVAHRYKWANDRTWNTGLSLGQIERIQETEFKPGNPGLIDRRFCQARVTLSNGHRSELYYLIEERQGFASIGWGVEFCVAGQDPWHIFDGGCRTVRR